MFTGLVEALAPVHTVTPDGAGGLHLAIELAFARELALGESVALNGCCLTSVGEGEVAHFRAGPETLAKTNLGELRPGERVNVERALRFGDRLGGHLVTGHIDGIGRIDAREQSGEWQTVWFSAPTAITFAMVPKGSIAVDGVSLTVVDIGPGRFSVMLIPHTLAVTTLGHKPIGAAVNLETDLIGKYVAQWLTAYR